MATQPERSHPDHDHPHDHEYSHDHNHSHEGEHTHPEHDRGHEHGHSRDHGDGHHHHHGSGVWGRLSTVFHLHGHSEQKAALASDQALLDNAEGIRTVWLALAALTVTALLQIVIVWWSGSVALLADTIHNIGDGLNSIPLLIAFYLARRAATRRYTYGFSRAEDVAGIFIVLSIAFSAGVIFWESIQKLIQPQPLTNLGWVAVAAVIGFLGNEAVALLQIRTGRRIDSAAMVADGLHARTDGLTSLAVLVAAGGAWLGFPIIDPIIGLLIGIAILFITRDASLAMWYRLMDAVDTKLIERAESVVAHEIAQRNGVYALRRLRMRWMGHRLHADLCIAVDPHLTTAESHHCAEHVRHALFHAIASLSEVVVHVDPWSESTERSDRFHKHTEHHEPVPSPIR